MTYSYDNGQKQRRMTNARTGNVWTRYTYDDIGQLKTAWGYDTNSTVREHEKLGYFYDAAGNLNRRTNNALSNENAATAKSRRSIAGTDGRP